MRDQICFRGWRGLTVAVAGSALFVFGASPVRAQTAPASASIVSAAAAQVQGGVRRLSIDEAVAMALEQNIDLQVDRIDPQVQDYQRRGRAQRVDTGTVLERHHAPPDQPAHRRLRRRHHGHYRPAFDDAERHAAGAAVGRRQLYRGLGQRPRHHQQRVQQLQPAAELDDLCQLHAAAAAQLQDRCDPAAGAREQEESRDLGRAAAAVDRGHHAQRQERLLGSRLRDQQPRRAAAVAAAGAAVVPRQQGARRDRHHGAARHRAGRGRGRAARRGRHPRRGVDLPRRGHAARAHLEPGRPARLLEYATRARRRGDLSAGDGGHRCRRAQRPGQSHRSRRLA